MLLNQSVLCLDMSFLTTSVERVFESVFLLIFFVSLFFGFCYSDCAGFGIAKM